MLILAFIVMIVSLGTLATWLHLFLSEKEGNTNFFKKRYDAKAYHDFLRILAVVSVTLGTLAFFMLWPLLPAVWYGCYWAYRRFSPVKVTENNEEKAE